MPIRRWPFDEPPVVVAALLQQALLYFNGDMIAALRNVFIEQGLELDVEYVTQWCAERHWKPAAAAGGSSRE
jgi:CRISPR/Cas system-associated exonuclease Cas4 (RecB family)